MTGLVIDNGILRWPHFLDRDECTRVRAAMDRGLDDPADVVGREIATHDEVRRTRSVEIDAAVQDWFEERLDAIRADVESALGTPLGVREGTGFLRYPPGGFYRTHRDRGDVAGWPDAARRAVSVVVFLNDAATNGAGEFEGGELVLYPRGGPPRVQIVPEAGLLVAFPSSSRHEVLPVRAGTRDAAVDWFYDG